MKQAEEKGDETGNAGDDEPPASGSQGLLLLIAAVPDAERLPLTREERSNVASLRRYGRLRPHVLAARRPSRVAALLRPESRNALAIIAGLETECAATKLRRYLDVWAEVRPLLGGDDLKALGIKPGPIYTKILQDLRDARLDRGVLTRGQELALVKRWQRKVDS